MVPLAHNLSYIGSQIVGLVIRLLRLIFSHEIGASDEREVRYGLVNCKGQ
jgi:hypothetical protein